MDPNKYTVAVEDEAFHSNGRCGFACSCAVCWAWQAPAKVNKTKIVDKRNHRVADPGIAMLAISLSSFPGEFNCHQHFWLIQVVSSGGKTLQNTRVYLQHCRRCLRLRTAVLQNETLWDALAQLS